jgi:hypothetical protein
MGRPHGTLDVMVVSAMPVHDTRAPVRSGFLVTLAAVPEYCRTGRWSIRITTPYGGRKMQNTTEDKAELSGLTVETWGIHDPECRTAILRVQRHFVISLSLRFSNCVDCCISRWNCFQERPCGNKLRTGPFAKKKVWNGRWKPSHRGVCLVRATRSPWRS